MFSFGVVIYELLIRQVTSAVVSQSGDANMPEMYANKVNFHCNLLSSSCASQWPANTSELNTLMAYHLLSVGQRIRSFFSSRLLTLPYTLQSKGKPARKYAMPLVAVLHATEASIQGPLDQSINHKGCCKHYTKLCGQWQSRCLL